MTQNYELQARIEHLESLEGEGTELVSISVPPSKSIGSIRERIAQEYAGAENIKSDQTRDRVQQALKRIQRVLRGYTEIPKSGLVVYAGVVDGELLSYVFDDLPTPVTESTYQCDSEFNVAQLVNAVAPSDTFGLVVVERGSAAIGRLVGERIIPIRTLESQVMGKTRAGGQSAQRFSRERERQEHEFFKQVAEIANDVFVDGADSVTGLVVGGTLATAKKFASNEYLDHRLQNRLLGTFSVEYANTQGLHQLVDKAEEQLLDVALQEEREYLDEFFTRLRDNEPVAYGISDVNQAIEFGAVDVALVSSQMAKNRREQFERSVREQGGDFIVVSDKTERGSRFSESFGEVAALLRFPVN